MSLHIHVTPMTCLCIYLWDPWHVSAYTCETHDMSLHIPVTPMTCLCTYLWGLWHVFENVHSSTMCWERAFFGGKKLNGEGKYLFEITVHPLTKIHIHQCVISWRCQLLRSYSVGDGNANDMEYWWDDNDRVKLKCFDKILSNCYFVKCHMNWPRTEPPPPRLNASPCFSSSQ
jgi:hypothetical protein